MDTNFPEAPSKEKKEKTFEKNLFEVEDIREVSDAFNAFAAIGAGSDELEQRHPEDGLEVIDRTEIVEPDPASILESVSFKLDEPAYELAVSEVASVVEISSANESAEIGSEFAETLQPEPNVSAWLGEIIPDSVSAEILDPEFPVLRAAVASEITSVTEVMQISEINRSQEDCEVTAVAAVNQGSEINLSQVSAEGTSVTEVSQISDTTAVAVVNQVSEIDLSQGSEATSVEKITQVSEINFSLESVENTSVTEVGLASEINLSANLDFAAAEDLSLATEEGEPASDRIDGLAIEFIEIESNEMTAEIPSESSEEEVLNLTRVGEVIQKAVHEDLEQLEEVVLSAELKDDLFRIPEKLEFKIGEVADLAGVKPYVLRYWENEFEALRPKKSRHNQRMYSYRDVQLIFMIKQLLYRDRFSIQGAKTALRRLKAQVKKDLEVEKEIESLNSNLSHVRVRLERLIETIEHSRARLFLRN